MVKRFFKSEFKGVFGLLIVGVMFFTNAFADHGQPVSIVQKHCQCRQVYEDHRFRWSLILSSLLSNGNVVESLLDSQVVLLESEAFSNCATALKAHPFCAPAVFVPTPEPVVPQPSPAPVVGGGAVSSSSPFARVEMLTCTSGGTLELKYVPFSVGSPRTILVPTENYASCNQSVSALRAILPSIEAGRTFAICTFDNVDFYVNTMSLNRDGGPMNTSPVRSSDRAACEAGAALINQ